jgi:hypothetical protein
MLSVGLSRTFRFSLDLDSKKLHALRTVSASGSSESTSSLLRGLRGQKKCLLGGFLLEERDPDSIWSTDLMVSTIVGRILPLEPVKMRSFSKGTATSN